MVSSVPASENGGSRREARWLLEGNVGRWGPRALRGTRLKGEGLLCAWSSWRAVGGAEAWCWQTGMAVPASGPLVLPSASAILPDKLPGLSCRLL